MTNRRVPSKPTADRAQWPAKALPGRGSLLTSVGTVLALPFHVAASQSAQRPGGGPSFPREALLLGSVPSPSGCWVFSPAFQRRPGLRLERAHLCGSIRDSRVQGTPSILQSRRAADRRTALGQRHAAPPPTAWCVGPFNH